MKRLGNIVETFLTYEFFDNAERCARKGKENTRRDIQAFLKEYNTPEKRMDALMDIVESVRNRTFKSSDVIKNERFTGGKWRTICTVPYYPDRILHFAIFNAIKDRVSKSFIKDMYSYDKGVHELVHNVRGVIDNWDKTMPIKILSIDIRKFYDSMCIDVLLAQLHRLIKDKTLMWMIEEILRSHGNVVIGMLMSTIFSSLYLTHFDRWAKEELKVKHYYRFADDFIVLHQDEKFLKQIAWRMMHYLFYNLKLEARYFNIFDIEKRPLDYCGYVHYRTHTLIRTKTKKKFVKNRHKPKSVTSYMGMLKWCNSRNLIHKIITLDNGKKRTNSGAKVS